MKLCLNKHSTSDKPHLISILECINLSDEVTSQEVDVLIREAVPVAVVISTSRLAGLMLSFSYHFIICIFVKNNNAIFYNLLVYSANKFAM